MSSPENKLCIVLCNVRSVYNVASIFRTADCLGISEIVLVGYTPTPIDRFNRLRKDFAKVALGAEETVPWTHFKTNSEAIKFLQRSKYLIISFEQHDNSTDYRQVNYKTPVALVFGNEVLGVPRAFIQVSSVIAEIPMLGAKESLNVGVTVGIGVAEATRNFSRLLHQ